MIRLSYADAAVQPLAWLARHSLQLSKDWLVRSMDADLMGRCKLHQNFKNLPPKPSATSEL